MMLRPPRPSDEASILEVLNADVRAAYGSDDYSPIRYRMYLESPSVEPERDIRVAETEDGTIVGYADVYREEKEGRETFWAEVRLARKAPTPSRTGCSIGSRSAPGPMRACVASFRARPNG